MVFGAPSIFFLIAALFLRYSGQGSFGSISDIPPLLGQVCLFCLLGLQVCCGQYWRAGHGLLTPAALIFLDKASVSPSMYGSETLPFGGSRERLLVVVCFLLLGMSQAHRG